MRPHLRIAACLGVVALAACAKHVDAADQHATAPPTPRARDLPQGLVPVAGTRIDAATGWPAHVVHERTGIAMVLIPAGEFRMGSPADEAGRGNGERQHRRVIERPFYLGETEVTFAQFKRFVQSTRHETDAEQGAVEGGHGEGAFATTTSGDRAWNGVASWRVPFPNLDDYRKDEKYPVVQVSWNDARQFCAYYGLELPTEAQWEYAARAGSTGRFSWGDRDADGKGRENVADQACKLRFPSTNVSFPFDDGNAIVSRVGSYEPNAWRLFDMHGNVAEWCLDVHAEEYPSDGAKEAATPGGPEDPRVQRGGAWLDGPDRCRSATRAAMSPQSRRDFIGFRVAMTLEK